MNADSLRTRFGRRLRECRKKAGWTQSRFSEITGISVEYLSKMERGLASPSFPVIERLAEGLRMHPSDFFTPGSPARREAPAARDEVKALQERVAELELIRREADHRMKNALQTLSSLVEMRGLKAASLEAQDMVRDLSGAVNALLLIHRHLSGDGACREVPAGQFLRDIYEFVSRLFKGRTVEVTPVFDVENVRLPAHRVLPCGLLLAEVLTNVFKHAFPGRNRGTVRIALRREGRDWLELRVSDDGVGFSGDGRKVQDGLGLELVKRIVRDQLRGDLDIFNSTGTTVSVRLPLSRPEVRS